MRNTDLIRASWKLKDPIKPDPQPGLRDLQIIVWEILFCSTEGF